MSDVEIKRKALLDLIGKHPQGHIDNEEVRDEFATLLQEYADLPGVDPLDVIFVIGSTVYDVTVVHPHERPEPTCIIDFDYMKGFMKEVFLAYGVEENHAETCSEVLIEADRRGIDSHGLGRLKPIYCDRMDAGILWPSKPIEVLKVTDTTALVDGHLGLGLYIGPHCMQMAIDKAKKHGVGFVAVKNSTHYGIAGYYVTMATEAGCIGFSGTNARPSIAPTFGVEPMLGM